jgi:hypothetical protein
MVVSRFVRPLIRVESIFDDFIFFLKFEYTQNMTEFIRFPAVAISFLYINSSVELLQQQTITISHYGLYFELSFFSFDKKYRGLIYYHKLFFK